MAGALLYVLLALGLNIVVGYAGLLDLGYVAFYAVGAYMYALLASPHLVENFAWIASALPGGMHTPVWAVIPLAAALAALAGVLLGLPVLKLRGDYLAIVTLGFGEIIRVIFQNVEFLGGALGLNGIPAYTTIFWVLALVAVSVFVVTCLVHSTYGRGFLATHDDEIASEAVGLNTTRYKIVAFVIGAFFAGTAGGLYGHFKMTITPTGFDFTKSIEIVVMVILGGMGNTVGVILAAILLTLLPELLRPVAEYRMIIYSLMLIILMLVRPQGLFNFKFGKAKL
jgi:branched-chain amino acid transport system permease protein